MYPRSRNWERSKSFDVRCIFRSQWIKILAQLIFNSNARERNRGAVLLNSGLPVTWVDSRSIVFPVTIAEGHIPPCSFYKTHLEDSVCGISLSTTDFWKCDKLWLHLHVSPVGYKPEHITLDVPLIPQQNTTHFKMAPLWISSKSPYWYNLTIRIKKSFKATFAPHCSVKEYCISGPTFSFWSI